MKIIHVVHLLNDETSHQLENILHDGIAALNYEQAKASRGVDIYIGNYVLGWFDVVIFCLILTYQLDILQSIPLPIFSKTLSL